jgi:tetratricopeptide (TPR) repeat protein
VNRFFLGILISWNCWAQTAAPQPIPWDHRDFVNVPSDISPREMSQDKPTGRSISVSQLQHKISKELGRSYRHAAKLSRAGEHEKAAVELETVVQRDPEFSLAQNLLGVEYASVGRFGDAERALRQSLQLDPDSWSGNFNLGLVLFGEGDLSGAEKSARRSLEISSQNPQSHLFLGYLLLLREETHSQGLKEVEFAAHTIPAAKRFLERSGTQ